MCGEGAENYSVEHESLVPGPFAVCSGRSVGASLSSHEHIASTTQNNVAVGLNQLKVKSRMRKKRVGKEGQGWFGAVVNMRDFYFR